MASGKPVQFELGRVLATKGVMARVRREEIAAALIRHAVGDWGVVDNDDKQANDEALRSGARILSAYVASDGTRFWIITEADRATTTVLLPGEY